MNPLQRIVWSEGMLLSPQHFQQQDLYHETLLDQRLGASSPHPWGCLELTLDEPQLERGQVCVRAFTGVLPRGTVLRFRSGEAEAPAARSLAEHFPAHRDLLEVYLAIPVERSGTANYARGESERARSRYIVEARPVLDDVAPTREEGVEFARRNTMLLFGSEAREDFESIKIAEVTRDRSGKICLVAGYVPPSLRVSACPYLVESLRRLLAATAAMRRALVAELQHRDRSSVEYGPDEVTRFLALSALGGALPVLKHLADSSDPSPYQLYLFLSQFAGQLSAFSVDEDPAALPGYVHHDARATFEPLLAKLSGLLRVAVSARVLTLALESRVDGMHLGRLSSSELLRPGVRYVLAVQSSVPEQSVYELVPRVGKVASWSDIPRYLNAAVSTVPLTAALRPPREVPIRPGKQYFMVSTDSPLWRSVLSEQTIAVHLPPPFEPKSTSVELFAIPAA